MILVTYTFTSEISKIVQILMVDDFIFFFAFISVKLKINSAIDFLNFF